MKTLTTLSVAIVLSLTSQVSMAHRFDANPQAGAPQQPAGQTRQDHNQARIVELLSLFDLNQDGQIGLDEVQSIRSDEFAKLDLDSNGFISFTEFQQAAFPIPPGGGMHGGGRGHHHPPMNGCPSTTATTAADTTTTTDTTTAMDATTTTTTDATTATTCQPPADRVSHQQAHFTRLDTDGDGQISKAEFIANLPLFDRFDCDENGIITQEELSKPCTTTTTTTTK